MKQNMKAQPKNTVRFISNLNIIRTARVRKNETHGEAAARVGINLTGRNSADGMVYLAEYNGQRGEARFA